MMDALAAAVGAGILFGLVSLVHWLLRRRFPNISGSASAGITVAALVGLAIVYTVGSEIAYRMAGK